MENEVCLTDLIHRGGIFSDVEGKTPQEIYEKVCKLIRIPEGLDADQICKSLCAREEILSTAVGNGIALPHARTPVIKNEEDSMVVVVYLKTPIEMKAPDERPVTTMFILLSQNSQLHLKILSTLAGLFRSQRFRKALEDHAGEETLSSLIKDL